MGEIAFKGREWTWSNNWKNEGFIEERLERVFGSFEWMVENSGEVVQHCFRSASDHQMLILDFEPKHKRKKDRFYVIRAG